MTQSVRPRGPVPRLFTAAAILGLAWTAGPAASQTNQNPTATQFYLALPVSTKNAKHEAAVKKATEHLEATRAKDRVPEFPGEKGGEPAVAAAASPADAAALAALPPVGPARALIAAAVQNQPPAPAPDGYRWVRLGERELFQLSLDPTAKADPDAKEIYDAAAKARADGKVYAHKEYNWLIFSRAAGSDVDYFTLVYIPKGDERITQKDLSSVVHRTPAVTPNPNVLVYFADPKRIEAFTGKHKAAEGSKDPDAGAVFLVVNTDAVRVITLTSAVTNGILSAATTRFNSEERERLYRALLSAVPRKPAGP